MENIYPSIETPLIITNIDIEGQENNQENTNYDNLGETNN